MNWSWHAFTIAGIPVRLHWTLLFVLAYYLFGRIGGEVDPLWTLYIATGLAMNFAIILIHELGHCWATRRVGGHVDQILLWPLGGMAYVGHSEDPRTDMFVAVSGPVTHLLGGALCVGLILLLGVPWDWNYLNPIARRDWWFGFGRTLPVDALNVNMMLLAFNLFVPAYPLDGGRILLDILTLRMGTWRASRVAGTISIVIGIGIIVLAFISRSIFLAFIGVWVLLNAMQLRAVAQADDTYSIKGYSDRGYRFEEPRKEGYFAKRRRLKRERIVAKLDAEEAELRRRVDELLDKVNRGGMGSLTEAERKTLEKASSRLRRRD
jgi:Zn-dependent protease